MNDISPAKVAMERVAVELVKMDQFHLQRMPRHLALERAHKRLREEMVDAIYMSPERTDNLARECRTFGAIIENMHGPVIHSLILSTLSIFLPTRKFD